MSHYKKEERLEFPAVLNEIKEEEKTVSLDNGKDAMLFGGKLEDATSIDMMDEILGIESK
jgi:hypothetical protein